MKVLTPSDWVKKVKIFRGPNLEALENSINEWLEKNNDRLDIKSLHQNSHLNTTGTQQWYFITILYNYLIQVGTTIETEETI